MNLWDLDEEASRAGHAIASTIIALQGDEVTSTEEEEDAAELFTHLYRLQDDLEGQVDYVIDRARYHDARALAIRREAKHLVQQATIEENKAKARMDYLQRFMQTTGRTKINGRVRSASIVNNGGYRPIKVDETKLAREEISDIWLKQITEIDMKAVRTALESGVVLDFAQLEDRGQRLSIK